MSQPSSNSSSGQTRAIADFAFGSQTHVADTSRPLAWLSPEELNIDLSDPVQRRFGDYELIEKIGQGGMGVVYRARQHGLERDVALKLLAAGPWASDEFVARFRREARNAARMQHPNIVEIYEFGHRDGLNYFSMRLVEGPSLAQRLAADGPMGEGDAAEFARLLAEAMDYAHRLDVLHLDLKPANVLIGRGREPMVADFGLARRVDAGTGGGDEEISGTPSYMAPEQAMQQSHPLSASTDIYGLGAILYEMLTGRPPFRGEDVQATLESVIARPPPPPRSLRPGLARDLEAICLRCLEKQPLDRYANARELAHDLQRFLDGHAVAARPLNSMQRLGRWTRREPQLATAVGAALLSLGLGGAATALSWREARQARADAEYLSLATVLPAARGSSLPKLSTLIRERLSKTARSKRAKELAQSRNPRDWMVAGLIGQTLREPLDAQIGDVQLRRALQAMPTDRHALLAVIRACRISWVRVDGFRYEGGCAAPDAARRLANLEPENLFAWTSQIDPITSGQDDDGRRMWQYEHVPATRARLLALLANAARATRWDSGTGALTAAKARAYGVDFLPMRQPALLATKYLQVEPELEARHGLWLDWSHAWDMNGSNFAVLRKMCNPRSPELNDSIRSDCRRVFRRLAESGDSVGVRGVGLAGIARLGKGTPLEAEAVERWRQVAWIQEQDIWSRETDPLRRSRAYTRDLENHGEWEANLLEADRVGVPRMPPVGWQPRDPSPLGLDG